MAQSIGNPGKGALDKIIEMRKHKPQWKSNTKEKSRLWIITTLAGLVAFVWGLSQPLLFFAAFFFLIISFVLFNKSTSTEDAHKTPDVKDITAKQFNSLVAENGDSTVFSEDEITWALGGAAEVHTRDRLAAGLGNSFTIINDIQMIKNERVCANIDHLILTPSSMIMVDTKLWKTPLDFVRRGESIYLSPQSPYKNSVSTCIYEATFLPQPPHALVFIVQGRAGRELTRHVTCVTHYMEKYPRQGEENSLKAVPFPVWFVSLDDSPALLHRIASQHSSRVPSVEDILTSPSVQLS